LLKSTHITFLRLKLEESLRDFKVRGLTFDEERRVTCCKVSPRQDDVFD
jgi:hypothetical protein